MKACFATNGFNGAIDCHEWAHAKKEQGGLNMRPKNCMTCGGNTKMYQAGGCFDAMGNSIPCNGTQLQGSSGVNWQNSQVPQQSPVNPALEGIDPALTMKMENQGSPYSVTPKIGTDTKKQDPYAIMQRFGIGMRGARTALSWISGAIERGRQNRYDYAQQTALGQMNPMPVKDFQETYNNPYGQMGGTNPFSTYAKYGGNLNTIMKEHMKFSNDAKFDFGSGDDDKGKMQKGGIPPGASLVSNIGANRYQVTYPGDTLTNNQLIQAKKQQLQHAYTVLPDDNQVIAGQYDKSGSHNWMFYSDDTIFGNPQASMYMYNLSQKDKDKMKKMNPNAFSPYVGNLPAPQSPNAPLASKKKGGYEIDRMLIVRKLLPELFMMGRMGRHRYGNSKYQAGGAIFPQIPQISGILNQTTQSPTDDLVAYQTAIRRLSENQKISRDEAKKLYDSWQNPDKIEPISQSVPMMMKEQGKTNYSISYPTPTGQGTKYYNTLDDWNTGMKDKQYSSQQISGDKSSASASIYGQLKKGGIHIKPENKGKFTDYCGGKVTGECIEKGLNSPSATIRKRANFARNARKWNH